MKIISHRGNIKGPIPSKENRPSYIDCALQLGLDVEVDVRCIDGKFLLGHDTPDFVINEAWILQRKDALWFHCKNLDAALILKDIDIQIKYFCHTSDPYVLTNTNHLWVHDLTNNLTCECIVPLLSEQDIHNFKKQDVYGICTDYMTLCKGVFLSTKVATS